jgi:nicotinamide-nucleotide amidase
VIFSASLSARASELIDLCRRKTLLIAAAESCTGGLISGLLTSIPGSSDVFDSGFVTYSNRAKTRLLGVPAELISTHGAVSGEVALAMAEGALANSAASISVAVTGVAGPGGGTVSKPIGLVHLGAVRRNMAPITRSLSLGDIGRNEVRMQTVEEAVAMIYELAGP